MSLKLRGGLAALICAAGLTAGCVALDTGTTPDPAPVASPPPPAPIVLKEGALILPGAASVRYTAFQTPAAGRLQVGLDWTATGDETDIYPRIVGRSYEGACAGCVGESCPSTCRRELASFGELRIRPTTVQTEEVLPAGDYELHVSFYDPLDYLIPWHPNQPPRVSVSYQIVLLPSAP